MYAVGLYHPLIRWCDFDPVWSVNCWEADEKSGTIRAGDGTKYETGFHLYRNWRAARKLGFPRFVEYACAVAAGMESGEPVIVARQLRIVPWYAVPFRLLVEWLRTPRGDAASSNSRRQSPA